MNAERRKIISEIASRLDVIKSDIENIIDEEQEYFDNMPENMQSGDKASVAEEAISNLEEAISDIETPRMSWSKFNSFLLTNLNHSTPRTL